MREGARRATGGGRGRRPAIKPLMATAWWRVSGGEGKGKGWVLLAWGGEGGTEARAAVALGEAGRRGDARWARPATAVAAWCARLPAWGEKGPQG